MPAEATRRRIVRAFRTLADRDADVPIDAVARRARVSVQTIYAHFGSKRGLLLAAIDEMQAEVGLYEGFEEVFASPHGEAALRRMLALTFQLWARGWSLVRFTLGARRRDPETEAQLLEVDAMRRTHLWMICRRLAGEGRLRAPLSAERAADLALALSTPTVYEELVERRGWRTEDASQVVVDLVVSAVIDPATKPVTEPPPNWGAFGLGAGPSPAPES